MVCDCLSKKGKFVLEFSPLVDTNVRCFSINNCKCVINDSIVKHILSEVDISFLFLDKAILYHLNVQTLNWKKVKHFCLIRTCVTHIKNIQPNTYLITWGCLVTLTKELYCRILQKDKILGKKKLCTHTLFNLVSTLAEKGYFFRQNNQFG